MLTKKALNQGPFFIRCQNPPFLGIYLNLFKGNFIVKKREDYAN